MERKMSQPAPEPEQKNAGVIVPPPLIYLGVLVAALAVDALAGGPVTGLNWTPRLMLGAALIVVGVVIPLIAAAQFRIAGTEVPPWKPSSALVTTSVYRFTRNPMYLGLTLIYAGIALLADSVLALIGLVPLLAVIHYGVIKREEHYLEIVFGEAYREYKQHVRRWL
jgi:protein-S-isoprenylcysteine O-methyltransferase Ste14